MIKILKYGQAAEEAIFAQPETAMNIENIVADIIYDVRKRGDEALYDYCRRFDKAELTSLVVTKEEIDAAVASVAPKFLSILEKAAENIRTFHARQVRKGFQIEKDGAIVGQKIVPVDRAGLYVPGGTAAYPSTVLMDAIPAKIAGVREVVMVTPPRADGTVNPVIWQPPRWRAWTESARLAAPRRSLPWPTAHKASPR